MSKTKVCFKCNNRKYLKGFYKHSAMRGGYLNKCKICARKESRNNPNNKANNRRREQKPERKRKQYLYNKQRRSKHPNIRKMRSWINNLFRLGKLKRELCVIRGCKGIAQAHHPDYRKKRLIIWLCFQHHRDVHKGKIDQRDLSREVLPF